mgnify:CR=1 FL=1
MTYCKVEKLIGKKILSIETGKIAKQADGAALVRYGDTMVLATAVSAPEEKEEADFFPLPVDYREKTYAAGKFPGGFFKSERNINHAVNRSPGKAPLSRNISS